ncbi:MAG: FAD-dependent oxidoreductase [Verrucomicrobia bacterium]|jgi:ferredoxin-NADP reductase|nr:FAD-dependent oxidoreductase [Verrucomicrobiota bacterium]
MSTPRKLRCAVASVTDHGGRVYTVDLVPESPVPAFRPGQFLHLTVDDYDPAGFWPESRVFSIASSPRDRRRLRICYSVKGRYTARMEQSLRPGSEVWVKLPYGDFVIDPTADAVLIAGGTGISAFTAFIEALESAGPQQVLLVYGARSPGLLLFPDLIARQLERVPGFAAVFFAEADAGALDERLAARAPCLPGRVSVAALWERFPTVPGRVFYLSGPPAMLKALGSDLTARGVPPDRVRTDAWE